MENIGNNLIFKCNTRKKGFLYAPKHKHMTSEPEPTDWGSDSPPPWRYVPHLVRRKPGTVRGWRAGGVAVLVRYVKWVGRTRGVGGARNLPFLRPGWHDGEATGKGA